MEELKAKLEAMENNWRKETPVAVDEEWKKTREGRIETSMNTLKKAMWKNFIHSNSPFTPLVK